MEYGPSGTDITAPILLSGLFSGYKGLFVAPRMTLDGLNVLQRCLLFFMELKGLWKFLMKSGTLCYFLFWYFGILVCDYTCLAWLYNIYLVVSPSVRHGVHRLPNSMVYLLVPGRLCNLLLESRKSYNMKVGHDNMEKIYQFFYQHKLYEIIFFSI